MFEKTWAKKYEPVYLQMQTVKFKVHFGGKNPFI